MGTQIASAPLIVSEGHLYLVVTVEAEDSVLFAINDRPSFDEETEGSCWHLGHADIDELHHFTCDTIPIGLAIRKMRTRHLGANLSCDERSIYIRARGPDGNQHSFILTRSDFKTAMGELMGSRWKVAI